MSAFRFAFYAVALLLYGTSVDSDPHCNNGEMELSDINTKVLDVVNTERRAVLAGNRQNGPVNEGKILPAAKEMDDLEWSCSLEEEAITILSGANCVDTETFPSSGSAPADKAYIYNKEYDYYDRIERDINSVLGVKLRNIANEALTDITEREVKYGGESTLSAYASLIRSTTTHIGCAFKQCSNCQKCDGSDPGDYSILCLTNEPFPKNGDVIYEFIPTTPSTTTESTTIATSTTTESTTTESTTTTAATTTATTTTESTTTTTPSTTTETTTTTPTTTTTIPTTTTTIEVTTTTTTPPTTTTTPPLTTTTTPPPTTTTTTTPTTTTETTTTPTTTTPTTTTTTTTAAVTTAEKSMCPDNGENSMTDELRIAYLAKHNSLRSTLALGAAKNGKNGTLLRQANRMPTLVYCCELEKAAYERAKQCSSMDSSLFGDVENNKNFTTNLERTLEQAGKNAIQLWWAEITANGPIEQYQNLFYTHLGINSFAKIASDLTTGVGCSVVHCGSSINVVCHYETTLKNAAKLYNCGPYCKQCPGGEISCVNGLCPPTDEQCPTATTPAATTTGPPSYMCPANNFMSDSTRIAVLDKHNALRSALALGTISNGKTGKLCRKASKMPTLTYNCDLEKSAYERAKLCSSLSSAAVPDGVSENSLNFTTRLDKRTPEKAAAAATNMWWSELSLLENGLEQLQNIYYTHLGINSFAKIASDLTTQVGCAVVRCQSSISVVCHYNTTLTNAVKLYTCGSYCKQCPEGEEHCYIGMCPAA